MNTYTGGFGFVLVPDDNTIDVSYRLASGMFGNDWEYVLSPGNLPHLTLYHSKMRDVPREYALNLRTKLNEQLQGKEFALNEMVCFGGKFIFWNVCKDNSNYDLLNKCHAQALDLAKYLDPSAAKRADEEGLSLTEEERENVNLYNHPLVRRLYTPHITLAYDERAAEALGEGESRKWSFVADRVEFAEIGHPGVVEKTITL
jgi:hypothetical protein